jgi:hypothetical protein
VKSEKRSIVMVDWVRLNTPTARTRNQFLWHQMLLSLLYDDVAALDETLVCSKKMAKWFGDKEDFRLLEETIECHGLSVLKRPWQKYPKELQERAQARFIDARREHLKRFSVDNDGNALMFNEQQDAFHNQLEAALLTRDWAHRPAGSKNKLKKDFMGEFGKLLVKVLTNGSYRRWLQGRFKTITPEIADDFVRFVRAPVEAVEFLKKTRRDQPPQYTPQQSGKAVFNTALAVQVAATYGKAAKELQDLIEMVFARQFCIDEGADGKYGRQLRDLPFPLNRAERHKGRIVRVETTVKIPLTLPAPGPNFSRIIQTVRELDSGKQLRAAMNRLGQEDATFDTAHTAWLAVADDLASRMVSSKMKKIDLRMLAVRVGHGMLYGALADFTLKPKLDDLPACLLGGAGGGALHGLYSIGGPLYSNLRADLDRQRIGLALEGAVEHSCILHPTVDD